ncbi:MULTISPECIES: prolipoprotein diacylglyceryl transferase [unclassified Frondihabitans]|uniref:prolipoprotein diacylglyceryl transferase n=1 Tax=unclassified Frondihabitans TaxID=2626248 RepID=UPI000F511510|nr:MULTISPECIES: prolipoprotein diacylglyceryl transferase [unclassified Frondihabitans]RPE73762.1 prolipoprotein diacylglyceryl transferase [Frondihabitans sp. PhB153]RPF02100.1 prolipoprotein diacylglyceryl transferase [Frondihabitans sp. PhB161]
MVTAAGIPSPPISYIQLGPLTVHFYALCLLVGMVIAVLVTNRRLVRRGVASGKVIDIAIWAIPIAIVGGRLYHVVTHPTDYFAPGDNLWSIPAVWQGGLAIFGSILFGTLGAYLGCRRSGVRFLTFADALAPGMLLAQAFGRFGNYFNQELYGNPTTLPWGLQISSASPAYPPGVPDGTLFQPLFLYEMIWNIGGALLLIFVLERRLSLHRGQATGFYFLWYGFARAILEYMRDDPTELYVAGLKINEDVAILAAILGLLLILVSRRRQRLVNDPASDNLDIAEDTTPAQLPASRT